MKLISAESRRRVEGYELWQIVLFVIGIDIPVVAVWFYSFQATQPSRFVAELLVTLVALWGFYVASIWAWSPRRREQANR